MPDIFFEGYFALFLIITIGIAIGNLKFKGLSLDLSAVIFVALFLGHHGFLVPVEFQTIGLVFFIFTVGIQAGPGFFDAFKKMGRKLIYICLLLIISAALLGLGFSKYLDIEIDLGIGVFTGALTSSTGLAAAIDATGSPLVSIGYGIAYPVGVIGVILFLTFLPVLLKIDMKKEENDYKKQQEREHPEVIDKNFVVENQNLDGKTIHDLEISTMTHAVISRVKHKDKTVTPHDKTRLYTGDIIKVVGTAEALEKIELLIGKPTSEKLPLPVDYTVNWILITNKKVINKPLKELNLTAYYNATITRIRRSDIDLTPSGNSTLRFGDKVMVASDKENIRKVMKLLGNEEKRLSETNFLPISLGIVIGILLGSINIPFFGLFDFSLGITGGILATAIILSNLGKTGPIIWSMSDTANQLLRKLGLLMFLATVGTHSGAHIVEAFATYGWTLFYTGATITVVPLIISILFGRYILKVNFALLLGVIAGSMTSTPGLAAIDSKTKTEAPALGYATVYPVALVLMIIVSQFMAML